jgi:hypothetical protein
MRLPSRGHHTLAAEYENAPAATLESAGMYRRLAFLQGWYKQEED